MASGWDWLLARDARAGLRLLEMEHSRPLPADPTLVVPRRMILRTPFDRGTRLWFVAAWLTASALRAMSDSKPPGWGSLVVAGCALLSFIYYCRLQRMLSLISALLSGAKPEEIPTSPLVRSTLLGEEWLARFGPAAVAALEPIPALARRQHALSRTWHGMLLAAVVLLLLSPWACVAAVLLGVALFFVSFRLAKQMAPPYREFRERAMQSVDAASGTRLVGLVGLFGPRSDYLAWCTAEDRAPYPYGEPPIPLPAKASAPPDDG